jgi:predicted enzyme related to lactoylglutathione lyase
MPSIGRSREAELYRVLQEPDGNLNRSKGVEPEPHLGFDCSPVKNTPILGIRTSLCILFSSLVLGPGLAAENLPPLNSPGTEEHFVGKFVWADLFTAEPTLAETFYTGLFGWTSRTIERSTASGSHPYVVLSVGSRPVAGIAWKNLHVSDEAHGRWVGYVSVPDVAKALGAAASRGGNVVSKLKDLPDRGTQAIFSDSEGATLGLVNSVSGDPGEFLPEPGDWTWAELFTRDPAAASAFYSGVVGYEAIADSRGDQPANTLFVSGGHSRASVRPVSDRPKAHPAWLLFVRVSDVRETAAKAVSLGGRVIVAPADKPTQFWRAVIADPTGARIGIIELDTPEGGEGSK